MLLLWGCALRMASYRTLIAAAPGQLHTNASLARAGLPIWRCGGMDAMRLVKVGEHKEIIEAGRAADVAGSGGSWVRPRRRSRERRTVEGGEVKMSAFARTRTHGYGSTSTPSTRHDDGNNTAS